MINSESDACEIFMRLIMVKNYQTPLNLEVLEELEKTNKIRITITPFFKPVQK